MTDLNAVKAKLEGLVNELLADRPDHFLVEVKMLPSKLQVFVDADQGIKVDTCAEISRYLEQYLDTEKPLGEKYVLEVSSPGMDNPLKVLRQYKRRVGREVIVVRTDGQRLEGVLQEVHEDYIVIEETIKSKKKILETNRLEIPFAAIKSTKLKLNF
ncbi:MAG: ribosome maturation factor [Chitinophagales bacterium]|nr:ribosome maturation factor [Chitinophagales bacterium]